MPPTKAIQRTQAYGFEVLNCDIPDFPKPGIVFRDITTLLRDPAGLRYTS